MYNTFSIRPGRLKEIGLNSGVVGLVINEVPTPVWQKLFQILVLMDLIECLYNLGY